MTSPSKKDAIQYIISRVPEAATNYKLLTIMYWSLIDGVNIPSDVIKEIIEKGTSPETIARTRRKVMKNIRRNAGHERTNSSRGA